MERTRFQQVDVTPTSTSREATDTFMVGALLYSSRGGVPLTGAVLVGRGATDTFIGCPPLLPYGDNYNE